MSRRRPRGLSAEERELWQKAMKNTEPIRRTLCAKMPQIGGAPAAQPATRTPIPQFQIGQKAGMRGRPQGLLGGAADDLMRTPVKMDRRRYERITRGKLAPEARIDLHGMTLAQAHPTLTAFVFRAHASEKRLILVITGKGRDSYDSGPIPVRRGILKHQVPQWLSSAPLSPLVLQIMPANRKHGGDGAYYVYLRRHRQ